MSAGELVRPPGLRLVQAAGAQQPQCLHGVRAASGNSATSPDQPGALRHAVLGRSRPVRTVSTEAGSAGGNVVRSQVSSRPSTS